MINWNTVPMTYNDSLSYMEMLGKCITVCQQLYDRVEQIVIDSEQININKEDISYLKDAVYALADRVDDIDTMIANTKTPQTVLFDSGDITIDETDTISIPIPENMRDASLYVVTFTLGFGTGLDFNSQYITMCVYRSHNITTHTEYIPYSGTATPVGITHFANIADDDTAIELLITTTATPVSVYGTNDYGSITAFWLPSDT